MLFVCATPKQDLAHLEFAGVVAGLKVKIPMPPSGSVLLLSTHSPVHPAAHPHLARREAAVLIAGLVAVLLWDAGGLDLTLAHWFGTSSGFALRDHWFMTQVMHEGARWLSWLVVGWLLVGLVWPTGWLRGLPRRDIALWVAATLLGVVLMSLVKSISKTSCPWDLAEFGGMAQYVSHWRLGVRDGGGGHCFPAGHAAAGFAHVAGWFALKHHRPRAARAWLGAALLAGVVLGLAQQVRGAHYLSHTLWTAWICGAASWTTFRLLGR